MHMISKKDLSDTEFDSKWDEILFSMTKIPPDEILEGLYKLRIRESDTFGSRKHKKRSIGGGTRTHWRRGEEVTPYTIHVCI